VLPIIHPAYAIDCLASMRPDVRARVVIVDNTEDGLYVVDVGATIRPPRNYGVARSWNAAIACHPARSYVLLSSQIRFGPTGGVDLLALAQATVGHVASPAPTHWHSIIFPADVLDRVGAFDENFYPAYYEDVDMARRCRLAGIPIVDVAEIDSHGIGDGHGVDALRHQHPGLPTCNYDALADYWQRKWGMHVADSADIEQGFRWPFGDDTRPLSWWPSASIDELALRYRIAVAADRLCPDVL
jgi:hypothetical protein